VGKGTSCAVSETLGCWVGELYGTTFEEELRRFLGGKGT